jgi:signal recognition particle receptor subunit beta
VTTPEETVQSIKVVIAGGFGSGKTTLVGAVSELRPLTTEELLTDAGTGVDDLSGIEEKHTTTVALDFGRITINSRITLYLFGTPGQDRFWYMWDELARGALGAIVLVDTRRLDGSFAAVDYFERRELPFVVAVNRFYDRCDYTTDEIRGALALSETIPIVMCDARRKDSSRDALIRLVSHALDRLVA